MEQWNIGLKKNLFPHYSNIAAHQYSKQKTDLIPPHPPLSKGGDFSPPFGKGRLGGILKSDFKRPN